MAAGSPAAVKLISRRCVPSWNTSREQAISVAASAQSDCTPSTSVAVLSRRSLSLPGDGGVKVKVCH